MKGAGAFGWKFILFSAVFYMFLGMILGFGGDKYLANTVLTPVNFTQNYTAENTFINPTTLDVATYVWQNPFSDIGWLTWITLAFLITDIYIIFTSVIP